MANKIYIYNPYTDSTGISVIITNFHKNLLTNGIKAEIIDNFNGISKDSIIIPYGLDGAYKMIKMGYVLDYVFMADAFTLGYKNKILFYLRHIDIFHYDFFYSVYCLIRDFKYENLIISKFKNVLLVSETDIDYLKKKKKSKSNYICIPNGVDLPTVETKINSQTLRLGILSSWDYKGTAKENAWFIENYFVKYAKKYPSVTLYLAGRGRYIHRYKHIKNVVILGEVDNLNVFFKTIDVFLVVNPKGCGILNRVLDAFAYKTPVLGYKKAFSGFTYMKDAYMEFSDYDSFERKLNELNESDNLRRMLSENAFSQIQKYNDWQINYTDFIKKYLSKYENSSD